MIQYLYLGRIAYDEALRLQEELVELRIEGRIGNVLLLLEHPPVLTLGRNANRANILASDQLLAARGVTIHEINRGGDVTYHGPGQLVGYPNFDLRSLRDPRAGAPGRSGRLGPVDFVRLMEEALIHLCGEFGVLAGRICGLTGVWCGLAEPPLSPKGLPCEAPNSSQGPPPAGRGRKVAAIGIHVSRGVTSHGFAFNVVTDLRDFSLIIPCGISDHSVTSLEKEIARLGAALAALPSLESIAERAALQFGAVFGEPVVAVESLSALRAQAQATAPGPEPPAPDFPAEDTPLQVPPEIERLRGKKERPIPA